MIRIVVALLCISYLVSVEADGEMYIFGKSYHTNRKFEWNESNYGLGVGVSIRKDNQTNFEGFIAGGSYNDSYDNTAIFCVAGPRYTIGERDRFHTSLSVGVGPYIGSKYNTIGAIGFVDFGYDRVSVCITGIPNVHNNNDNENMHSAMIATFLKIRIKEF